MGSKASELLCSDPPNLTRTGSSNHKFRFDFTLEADHVAKLRSDLLRCGDKIM